ncbi:MAG: hypothetical protein J7L66_06310 [Anaerolineaceae bacterium]|nr:hypothetical protein [Anaerolineaceae bacterium]
MKKCWIISLLILFLITACASKDQSPQTEPIEALNNNDDVLITPKCTIDGLPTAISPIGGAIVDPSPPHVFIWDIDCIPDDYKIRLFKDGNTTAIEEFDDIDPTGTQYTSQIQLEPLTSYTWELQVYVLKFPKEYASGDFQTGPLCAAEDLVAPMLVSPSDGSVDTGKGWGSQEEVNAVIKYPVGDCRPKYFEIDYSLNANFSGGANLNPSGPTIGKKEGDWLYFDDDSTGTVDCNLYYWRARSVVDTGHSDWSETFTFYLDVYGNCYVFPEFKALKNANCRRDPWAGENYVGVIWEGDTAELLGLNEDASWGMFKLKNELECWANMNLLEPDPPDALFFPGYYPVLEHGEPPDDIPAPASDDEPSDGETPIGCMAPSGRSGTLTCQIPCPDPKYAARVCP